MYTYQLCKMFLYICIFISGNLLAILTENYSYNKTRTLHCLNIFAGYHVEIVVVTFTQRYDVALLKLSIALILFYSQDLFKSIVQLSHIYFVKISVRNDDTLLRSSINVPCSVIFSATSKHVQLG